MGDNGRTQLVTGHKVPKHHPRLMAYGTLDELNSHCGLLGSMIQKSPNTINDLEIIHKVQNELFNLGSQLACDDPDISKTLPNLDEDFISTLETRMDQHSLQLMPLNNFILPGGSVSAAQSHICRCVCRRAERELVQLKDLENLEVANCTMFINRLSDYFFSLARWLNLQSGIEDVLWGQKFSEAD